MPDSVTQILKAGPVGEKLNIAVLGDGFAEEDQETYNDKVDELLMEGVFGHDYFYEDKQAFNIFRVNLISKDSGVSQRVYDEHGTPSDKSDDTIKSTKLNDTALGYIFSGSWAHCWLEKGAKTDELVQKALDIWVPDYDLVLIILNESQFGGCGGGSFQIVTLGSSWAVMAHEFGHGTGGLADEYCRPGTYSGGEPSAVNITANKERSTLKWGRFVNPETPVVTGKGDCAVFDKDNRPEDWDSDQDVGLFEGGQYSNQGKYRPVENCRMKGNDPKFCPVCYTALKTRMHPYTGRTFLNSYKGDFNGDGKDDLLVHNDNSIMIFRSNGKQLECVFSEVAKVPGSWQFKPNDQFYIGDFNGDGKDEVVVFNGVDWPKEYLGLLADDGKDGLRLIKRYDDSMPDWPFRPDDRFYVADFNADGRQDLYVFNGKNWSTPYLGMLASTGKGFNVLQRYETNVSTWSMRPNDQLYTGDFIGDGRADLWIFNGTDWSFPYLGMLSSGGSSLATIRRFERWLPGWTMKDGDQHLVGDFNGDGKADLYVFNGKNWNSPYLGMLSPTSTGLKRTQRYDGSLPGWTLGPNDRYYLADINQDGKDDLFVYNAQDWSKEYLATLISDGSSLTRTASSADWVGDWNLNQEDQFIPCNFEGGSGSPDLFAHKKDWFGMIRANSTISLQKMYYQWIHNYRYGRN